MVMHRVMALLERDRQLDVARAVVTKIMHAKLPSVVPWWRWTVALAAGITMRRIERDVIR